MARDRGSLEVWGKLWWSRISEEDSVEQFGTLGLLLDASRRERVMEVHLEQYGSFGKWTEVQSFDGGG